MRTARIEKEYKMLRGPAIQLQTVGVNISSPLLKEWTQGRAFAIE
jgi:hypothetical protein